MKKLETEEPEMIKMLFHIGLQLDTFCEAGYDFLWGQKQYVSKPMISDFNFETGIEEQIKATFDWAVIDEQC